MSEIPQLTVGARVVIGPKVAQQWAEIGALRPAVFGQAARSSAPARRWAGALVSLAAHASLIVALVFYVRSPTPMLGDEAAVPIEIVVDPSPANATAADEPPPADTQTKEPPNAQTDAPGETSQKTDAPEVKEEPDKPPATSSPTTDTASAEKPPQPSEEPPALASPPQTSETPQPSPETSRPGGTGLEKAEQPTPSAAASAPSEPSPSVAQEAPPAAEPQSSLGEQPTIAQQSPPEETNTPPKPPAQEDKALTATEQQVEQTFAPPTEQSPPALVKAEIAESPPLQPKSPPVQSTASLPPPASEAPQRAPTAPPATKLQPVVKPQRKPASRIVAHSETEDRHAPRASNASNQAAAPAQTRAGVSAAEIDAYKSEIVARINAAKHYPEDARSRGARGVAVVSFSISPSGALGGASLQRTSGDSSLDGDAVATVRRAAPFPAPPAGAARAFSVALNYRP